MGRIGSSLQIPYPAEASRRLLERLGIQVSGQRTGSG